MTALADHLPVSTRLERQLYFVTCHSAGGWMKVRSGSIAATEPRELSGRSETTSGQPDQLPLRPRANDRIGLRAAAQIVKANGSDRPTAAGRVVSG